MDSASLFNCDEKLFTNTYYKMSDVLFDRQQNVNKGLSDHLALLILL